MRKAMFITALVAAAVSTGVLAADMLPLKQGIYVPANRPCKGPSNAEIVNYWGGNASFGSAQATCKISKMTRKGNVFTITDKCADIRAVARSLAVRQSSQSPVRRASPERARHIVIAGPSCSSERKNTWLPPSGKHPIHRRVWVGSG